MDKLEMKRLFSWFDRVRSETGPELVPEPVTRVRAAMAHDFLRTHSGIDFDAFHQAAKAEAILDEPLGSTADCLTSWELSRVIQSHARGFTALPDIGLVTRVVAHVAQCSDCWDTVEEYQECEIDSLINGVAPDSQALADAMWIAPVGAVRIHGEPAPCLSIGVVTHETRQRPAHAVGAMRLRLIRPFQSAEVPITPVAEVMQLSWSLMERVSIPGSDDRLVMGSYKTGGISSLRESVPGDLGYVTVSRGAENRAVHATRIIRFGKIPG